MENKRITVEEFFIKDNIELIGSDGKILNYTIDSFDFLAEVLNYTEVKKEEQEFKELYLDANTDIVHKYLLYKNELTEYDPDTRDGLLKSIYKELWNEKCLKKCENSNIVCYSDTMTSAQGLLNAFYKLCSGDKKCSPKIMYTMYQNLDEYKIFSQYFIEDNEDSKIIRDFIKHYHTLGNYIPVPQGFNRARSGSFASHDMWDITLIKIKEYYCSNKKDSDIEKLNSALCDLLHINKNTYKNTKLWLDYFGSWKEFVDQNYLKEVEIDGMKYKNYVNEDYEIVDIFKKLHSFDKPAIHDIDNPASISIDAYLQYFKEITDVIKGRSHIIKSEYIQRMEGNK